MVALFLSVLTGTGIGLLVWYGWAAADNVREIRLRRAQARAEATKTEAEPPARKR